MNTLQNILEKNPEFTKKYTLEEIENYTTGISDKELVEAFQYYLSIIKRTN